MGQNLRKSSRRRRLRRQIRPSEELWRLIIRVVGLIRALLRCCLRGFDGHVARRRQSGDFDWRDDALGAPHFEERNAVRKRFERVLDQYQLFVCGRDLGVVAIDVGLHGACDAGVVGRSSRLRLSDLLWLWRGSHLLPRSRWCRI